MNDRIDAVLVDTSVYHKKQCDFEGITNSIIPMLLQLLRANNIKLLSHPILMREIKKDIDLDLEEAEIEERNMVDYSECEDGYRTERAEAQEEYYRH